MCGIVGCVGPRTSDKPLEIVLEGLARLEYRGYDSAGVAVGGVTQAEANADSGQSQTKAAEMAITAEPSAVGGNKPANPHNRGTIQVAKKAGKLTNLLEVLQSHPLSPGVAAIGHTRWATHGGPTDANAHPHVAGDGKLALIHNGIIENADRFRTYLASRGIHCLSQTDTEVVAHLLERAFNNEADNDESLSDNSCWLGQIAPEMSAHARAQAARLGRAMLRVMRDLEGAFTLLAMHQDAPGVIVAARRSSPLVVGLGEDSNYLGSDVLAFASQTDQALIIGQDELVVATASGVLVTDEDGVEQVHTCGLKVYAASEKELARAYQVDFSTDSVTKEGWPTFMEKEINEQPRAVADTLADRLDGDGYLTLDELRIEQSILRRIDKVIIIACGTASYAGMVARYAIEHWCRIPCEVELASEFRYRDPVVNEKTLVIAISQSGETMDTIMAMRHAREQDAKVVAIVNTPGSTISRESDAVLLTKAGPEIAVASTKAFLAQVTACYLFGLYLAQVRGNKYIDEIADYLEKLGQMPPRIQQVLDQGEAVRQIARSMSQEKSFIFLGRHVGFPVALEGALKLKEIAYVHAEGFAAGELKHGPIALIDEGQPVLVIVPTPRRPELHRKVLSNIQEVRARGARTIIIAEEGDKSVEEYAEVVIFVPPAPTLYLPLLSVVPLQIFACELASVNGLDVDQPRNLAKSVTVE